MAHGSSDKSILRKAVHWLRRIVSFVAVALVVGWGETKIGEAVCNRAEPAGFFIGAVDGALMPLSLPVLLLGKDVPIYAEKNVGRLYKLGYVLGVTLCGAIFFGVFFKRVGNLRRNRMPPSTDLST